MNESDDPHITIEVEGRPLDEMVMFTCPRCWEVASLKAVPPAGYIAPTECEECGYRGLYDSEGNNILRDPKETYNVEVWEGNEVKKRYTLAPTHPLALWAYANRN